MLLRSQQLEHWKRQFESGMLPARSTNRSEEHSIRGRFQLIRGQEVRIRPTLRDTEWKKNRRLHSLSCPGWFRGNLVQSIHLCRPGKCRAWTGSAEFSLGCRSTTKMTGSWPVPSLRSILILSRTPWWCSSTLRLRRTFATSKIAVGTLKILIMRLSRPLQHLRPPIGQLRRQ